MTTTASLTDLKKELAQKTKAELIEEIALLYKKFPQVKEYYQATLASDDSAILNKYKSIIEKEFIFNPNCNPAPKGRLSVAKKAVTDFKKVSQSKQNIAEMMLFYVESGVKYGARYGDMQVSFYSSLRSMYENLLEYIVKEQLVTDFNQRLKTIVVDSEYMGYGFNDYVAQLYEDYQAIQSKLQLL